MYNTDALAERLVEYVQSGILTEENANAVFNAAEYKNEAEASNDVDDLTNMTLESALDVLGIAEEAEEAEGEEDEASKAEAEAAKKKLVKTIAITSVAAAATAGTGAVLLTQTQKGRAKILASYHDKAHKLAEKAKELDKASADTKLSAAFQKKRTDLTNEINSLNDKIDNYRTDKGFLTLLAKAAKAGVKASQQTPEAKVVAARKNDKDLNAALKALENGKISQDEFDKIAAKVKARSQKAGIKIANESTESALDMINEFLEERALERLMEEEVVTVAPAETNPATHVEDEIDEKLPTVTPNESDVPADDPEMAKTDKAIEDAKKDLDVAGKLAEMRAKHDAEKDTTQDHDTIKQALESESITAAKLNIYESFEAGTIDEEEKNTLLEIMSGL